MPSLYVLEPGARLEIEHHRLLVTKEDDILMRVPVSAVTLIVLLGPVGLTTPAAHTLLHKNIPVIFLSSGGRFLGQLTPALSYNLPLRLQQYQCDSDPDFSLNFSKMVVAGKIHNQAVQAARWLRRRPDLPASALQILKTYQRQAESARSMDVLLGMEGGAAKTYFDLMKRVIPAEWGFTRRSRRPPKDPINAMLSFGYTLLTYNASAALQMVGLDPYLGYFHVEAYGRPALALDLMEEFRAPVVDSMVVSIINRAQVTAGDFSNDPLTQAVRMSLKAKRIFIKTYSRKMAAPVKTSEINRPISYQKHLEVQARKISSLVRGKSAGYQPFEIR